MSASKSNTTIRPQTSSASRVHNNHTASGGTYAENDTAVYETAQESQDKLQWQREHGYPLDEYARAAQGMNQVSLFQEEVQKHYGNEPYFFVDTKIYMPSVWNNNESIRGLFSKFKFSDFDMEAHLRARAEELKDTHPNAPGIVHLGTLYYGAKFSQFEFNKVDTAKKLKLECIRDYEASIKRSAKSGKI